MKPQEFFATRPVFTLPEFREAVEPTREHSRASEHTLAYYSKQGRLRRIRRGVYAVVPVGSTPEQFPFDPFLVAGKLTEDAVLGYHTALACYGKTYSATDHFQVITQQQFTPIHLPGAVFSGVSFPRALLLAGQTMVETTMVDRSGVSVRVTTFERTLVDSLDRPQYSPSWEELWRALALIEYVKPDAVIRYVQLLGNATTAAKVGLFLEQHREALMIDDTVLVQLETLRPISPQYIMGQRHRGRLITRWNLVVPEQVANRGWEEF